MFKNVLQVTCLGKCLGPKHIFYSVPKLLSSFTLHTDNNCTSLKDDGFL